MSELSGLAKAVRKKPVGKLPQLSVEISEAKAIEANCPSVKWVSPVVTVRTQLIAGSSNWSSSVLGVYANYLNIRDMKIENGRNFTESEVYRAVKVCLLGKTVVKEMFGDFANPVGQSIRINKVPFKIIGILQKKRPIWYL